MEIERKKLTDEELESVFGSAGLMDGLGRGMVIVAAKHENLYCFGTIVRVVTYRNGVKGVFIERERWTLMGSPTITIYDGTGTEERILSADPNDALIKQVYDLPELGEHPCEYLDKWIK